MNLFNFIKQKISIIDVINSYVNLKKAGSYYKARCPFHQEKTASFTVSPHKEIFYCFGCHTGGDVISFIARIENCTQLQAAKHLVELYKLVVPQEIAFNNSDLLADEKGKYIKLCTLLANWCHANLNKYNIAQNYLDKRNISKESIKKFLLGYFPAGQQYIKNLLAYANKNSVLAQDFMDAKLVLEKGSASSHKVLYSPFENRIIFPISDHFGNIVGFGGRVFMEQDERAKYYNSHEYKFFNKSNILFGLDKAKKKIQEKECVFLVEGYTDVIAMVQNGFQNTVATLGTSCTQEHLQQISRYAQKIYVTYDGDEPGQKAILRLLELCWQVNVDLYVIELGKDEDPASYLEKNKGSGHPFEILIKNAKDIFIFFIDTLGKDFGTKSLTERIELSSQIIEIITNMKDPIKQSILLVEAAEKFHIPFESLKKAIRNRNAHDINRDIKRDIRHNIESNKEIKKMDSKKIFKITLLEKKLFSAILFNKGTIEDEDVDFLNKLFSEPVKSLFEKIIKKKGIVGPQLIEAEDIMSEFTEEEKSLASKLIIETDEIQNGSLDQMLTMFYKKNWKFIIKDIKDKIDISQKQNDNEKVKEYLISLDLLKKKLLQRTSL